MGDTRDDQGLGDDLSKRLGGVLRAAVNEGALEYWEAYEVMMTVCGSAQADEFGPEPLFPCK
jgi:hypothetical protein